MLGLSTFLAVAALASATVLPVRPERRVADADFLKRQKEVLDLFVGVGHNQHYKNERYNWDLSANLGNFVDEKYPKSFLAAWKSGRFIPYDGIFSMACHHTMHDAIKLFDVFYFAKDFDTFINAANWAKGHVNPGMFSFAYSSALLHRPDCQNFVLPPLYEVFPNYFLPTDTFHDILDFKLTGVKEGKFNYNNTGYEYNYHGGMFGGPLAMDNRGYGDFRVSYFREDVGLNSWLAYWFARNPSWMCPDKYGKVRFHRRGENFYYAIQQIFARYNLERIANRLPYTPILGWKTPVQVGYNPRIAYFNGIPMIARPDNVVPLDFNPRKIYKAETFERRVWDLVDAGVAWELTNRSFVELPKEDSIDILGRIIYGTTDRPSKSYYKSMYFAGLDALAYLTSNAADRSFIGNALSTPMTAPRDPMFWSYLARVLLPFQHHKKNQWPYRLEELNFPGVTIQSVEIDRFLTYFDMFDYEVTNGVPMVEPKQYTEHRYIARQYRLNHKPFHFNITVNSEKEGDAMVRVFIGPKYDSEERLLNIDQARMTNFEIDRFPVKLSAGVNTWERSSSESPVFVHDQEGFRALYNSINNAEAQKEQFYVQEGGRCGLPDRLQLPMGSRGGQTYVLWVAVTPWDRSLAGDDRFSDVSCGGSRLYDGRAMGFPFDRPIRVEEFRTVPNIFHRDVVIYHRDESDVNRPSA